MATMHDALLAGCGTLLFALESPAAAQSVQPSQSAQLLQSAQSAQLSQSAQSAQPTQPAQPADSPAQQLAPVVVEAQRPPPDLRAAQVNGLTDAPLAQTPLSAGVLTAAQLAERGVESLSAAIRELPAATDNYNTFGYVEALQVRGVQLDEVLNYRRDGLTISSHAPVALEDKEAVEILYGASGILSGVSAPGGLVNYVLKRPTDAPLRELTMSLSEHGSVETHLDVGGRFGGGDANANASGNAGGDGNGDGHGHGDQDGNRGGSATGDRFGYRVNLAAEDRRPDIRSAWSQRALASGFFDWRVARGTLLEAEIEQHDVREISVPGIGLLDTSGIGYGTTLPPVFDPRANLNNQPWTLPFESRETVGSLRLTQQLDERWRAGVKLGLQRIRTNDRIAFPDGCSAQPVYVYPGLCANDDVDIYDYRSNGERRLDNDLELSLHGTATTGALAHELSFGAEQTHYSERYPLDQVNNFVGTINALAPTDLAPDPTPQSVNTDTSRHIDELFAFDVIRFGSPVGTAAGPGDGPGRASRDGPRADLAWSAWLGARATRIGQDSQQNDGSETVSLVQHLVTPFAALGYQPWQGGFAYLSAGGGLETAAVPNRITNAYYAGGNPVNFANPGAVLPAARSRQVELGFKQTAASGTGWSAALFEIERPTPELILQASGEVLEQIGAQKQRNRGVDLSASVRPARDWFVEIRAELIDARVENPPDPRFDGWHVNNVAPLTASARAVWTAPSLPGLSLSNLFTLSGRKPALPANLYDAGAYEVTLPAYWQWDAAATYSTTLAGLRALWIGGIDNVTNRLYWREAPTAPWGGTYLFPAAARTFRIALRLAW